MANTPRGMWCTLRRFPSASNPQSDTIPINTIGTMAVALDGGHWKFEVSSNTQYERLAEEGGGDGIFVTGTLRCYTASGF